MQFEFGKTQQKCIETVPLFSGVLDAPKKPISKCYTETDSQTLILSAEYTEKRNSFE